MIVTHPENLKLLPNPELPPDDNLTGTAPLNFIPVRTCVTIPQFRKTGRLIWPDDPFVTYEESDRSWGVALGIATEEVEPLFYEFTPPQIEDHFKEVMEEMNRKIIESFAIPERIIANSDPHWSMSVPLSPGFALRCVF